MLALYAAADFTFNILSAAPNLLRFVPFVAVIAFLGLMVWIVYDLKKANERLLDSRPSITVRPQKNNDDYYLEVANVGSSAEFECQIRIMGDSTGNKKGETYLGFWEFGVGSKATLMNFDRIKIAHIETSVSPLGVCLSNG